MMAHFSNLLVLTKLSPDVIVKLMVFCKIIMSTWQHTEVHWKMRVSGIKTKRLKLEFGMGEDGRSTLKIVKCEVLWAMSWNP